jgi:hypothetical protein
MLKFTPILLIVFFVYGCSGVPAPEITVNTFTDRYAPGANTPQAAFNADSCVKVIFPDTLIYKGADIFSNNFQETVAYNISLPAQKQYQYKIVKRRFTPPVQTDSEGTVKEPQLPDWARLSLSEYFDESVKVYEIPPSDENGLAGVVIFTAASGGDIYLRGIIGAAAVTGRVPAAPSTELSDRASAIYLMIDRLVQRKEYAHLFSLQHWRETSAGKRFINEMKKEADWFINNVFIAECPEP